MGKGYAEGPAAEEAERRREEIEAGAGTTRSSSTRLAVEGSTSSDPSRHFLGWADEVDADELFASGAAWGIHLVRRSP